MPRRVTVPDDLFRPTVVPDPEADGVQPSVTVAAVASPTDAGAGGRPEPRTASGRVKHDEKITVYVTADELLDVESARLLLRREHRLAVDRGRLVRAAIALALADLEDNGADSALVRRLGEA